MKNRVLKVFLPFVILTLFGTFFTHCKKSDTGEEEEIPATDFSIAATEDSLLPMQITTFKITGKELVETGYNGKLGTEPVIFKKISATELVAIIPDVSQGNYLLKCYVGGKTVSCNIQVTANEAIDDASMFVGLYISDVSALYAEVKELDTLSALPADMQRALDNMTRAENDFRNLSEKDQMKVARFLQNNQKLFTAVEKAFADFIADNSTVNMTLFEKCLTLVTAGIALANASTLGVGVAASLVVTEIAFRIFTGKASPLFYKVKYALNTVLNMVYWPQNYLAQAVFNQADKEFSNWGSFKAKTAGVVLNDGEDYQFRIKPWYRTLNANDINSPETVIAGLVAAYNDLKSKWTTYLSETFGPLPCFTNKTSQEFGAGIENYSIEITENAENVAVAIVQGNQVAFSVRFTTSALTDQDFSFDIVYREKGVESRSTVAARLTIPVFNVWAGYMIMTENAKVDPDCECTGTGGCQACKRGLFGSSWGTQCPIAFAYSSGFNGENFKQEQTVGGNFTTTQIVCYQATIEKGKNFMVAMNGYAPGDNDTFLNDVFFEITESSAYRIAGVWHTSSFIWKPGTCAENASGTWEVTGSAEPLYSKCDVIPHNP